MANKKTQEICYQLVIRKSFQKEIANLRKELGISPDGINNSKEGVYWEKQLKRKVEKIRKKFANSFIDNRGMWECIYFYTLFGESGIKNLFEKCDQIFGGDIYYIEKNKDKNLKRCLLLEAKDEGFLLYLKPYITKSEAKKFIDAIWRAKKVNKLFKHFPRIRERKHKNRDEIIFNLQQKPKKELDEIDKECNPNYTLPAQYKEGIIRRILKNKYKININEENIRKIASIQKKLRVL